MRKLCLIYTLAKYTALYCDVHVHLEREGQGCRYWEEGLVNVAALSSVETFRAIAFCSISNLVTDQGGDEVNLLHVNKTQGKELRGLGKRDSGGRLKLYVNFLDMKKFVSK